MNKLHIYKTIDIKELNKHINSSFSKTIDLAERQYNNKLNNIINTIINSHGTYKILLLAGPSSSGKTTTAQLLKYKLKLKGVTAWVISLDDFFFGSKEIPIFENDEPDYESLNSLDVPLIHKCLKELAEKSKSEFPIFDFITNERSKTKRIIEISNDDIVILEGLHALNPELLHPSYSDSCLKVYISVSTNYTLGGTTIINPIDLRFLRRIIRDYKFRNTPPHKTFNMWPSVCNGEKLYIEPFKESAQIFIDSCLSYEPCIFHQYISEKIKYADKTNIYYKLYYDKFLEVYNPLTYFKALSPTVVPKHSVLREFIGKK